MKVKLIVNHLTIIDSINRIIKNENDNQNNKDKWQPSKYTCSIQLKIRVNEQAAVFWGNSSMYMVGIWNTKTDKS